jgi:hypothetical protein
VALVVIVIVIVVVIVAVVVVASVAVPLVEMKVEWRGAFEHGVLAGMAAPCFADSCCCCHLKQRCLCPALQTLPRIAGRISPSR